MSDSKLTKISNEFDMIKIMQDIGTKFFGSDMSSERIGMLGHVTESMAHMFGAAILDSNLRSKEFFTKTAKRMDTLLNEAFIYGIEGEYATPSTMRVYIGIYIENLIGKINEGGYGIRRKIDPNDSSKDQYYFVLEKDTVITISDFSFMFENDIEIQAIPKSGLISNYFYSVRNLTTGDKDYTSYTYDNWDENKYYTIPDSYTLSDAGGDYLQSAIVNIGGKDALIFMTNVKQISKKSEYYTVYKNDDITLTGLEFMYDDSLAYFNIYYKEDSNSEWVLLNKVSSRDTNKYSVNTIKYSIELDTKKILLSVSNFTPKFNAEFRVDMYTTKGSLGNISYDGIGDDVYVTPTSFNERHSYAGLFVSCMPLSDATGGVDVMDMAKLRDKIILTKSILNGIMTDTDLNNYAKLKDELNTFLFIKKRSDIHRRYSAFTIPRMSNGDIIPSTTLTALIKMNYGFQQHHGTIVNSEEKNENNIPIYTTIKAGSAFEKVEIHDEINDFDKLNKELYYEELFIKSYNSLYTDSIQIEPKFAVKLINKLSVSPDEIVEAELNDHRYALPFTLVHNNTYNLTSTYLSSISDTQIMKIGYENPNSDTHFFIDHMYIYRNSISGSNTYTIKVTLFSNGDFSNAEKNNVVNSGDVENTLMLKGFIYNSDSVETVIDFKFESYNDYLFTFSAEMQIDDSFNSAEKTNLLNGYDIKNLNYVNRYNFILRPDLYTIKDAPMTYSVNKYNHYMKSLVYDKHYKFESFNKYKGDYFAIPTLYRSEEKTIDKKLYEFKYVTNTDDDLTYVRTPIALSGISNIDYTKFATLSKIKRRRTRIGYYTDYAKYVNEPTLFAVDNDGNILGNIKNRDDNYKFTRPADKVRSSIYMNPIYDTVYYYLDSSGNEVEINTPRLKLISGTKSSGGCVSYYSNTNANIALYDTIGTTGIETDNSDINKISYYRKYINGAYQYFSINDTITKYIAIVTKEFDVYSIEFMKYDNYISSIINSDDAMPVVKLNAELGMDVIYVKNGDTYTEVDNFEITDFSINKYYRKVDETNYELLQFDFGNDDSEGKYVYADNKSDVILYFKVNENVFSKDEDIDTKSYHLFTKDSFIDTIKLTGDEDPFWILNKESIRPELYSSLGIVSVDYKNPADMIQYPTYSDKCTLINDVGERKEYLSRARAYIRNYKELDYDYMSENGIDLNLDVYVPVNNVYKIPNISDTTKLTKTDVSNTSIGGMYYQNIPISWIDTSTTAITKYKTLLEKGNGTNIITNVYGGNIAKLLEEYVQFDKTGTNYNKVFDAFKNGSTKFYVCTYFKKVEYPNERDFNDGIYYVYTNEDIYPLGTPMNVNSKNHIFDISNNDYYIESYDPVDDPTIEEYRAGLYYILYYTGIYGPALNSSIDGIGGSVDDITDEEFERIPRKYYKRTRIYTEVPSGTNETVFKRLYNDNLLYTAPGGLDVTTVYSYPMKLVNNFFKDFVYNNLNIVVDGTNYAPIYYVKFSDAIETTKENTSNNNMLSILDKNNILSILNNLDTDKLSNYYIPVLLNGSPYNMVYNDGNTNEEIEIYANISALINSDIDVYVIGPMQESHEYIKTDDVSKVSGKKYYVKNILSGYTEVEWKNENKSYYYELQYDYLLANSKYSTSKVNMYSREVYGYDINSLMNNKYTPIDTSDRIKSPITNKILIGYNNNQRIKLNNKTYTVYKYILNGYDNELDDVYGSNDGETYAKIGSYINNSNYTPFNSISYIDNQYNGKQTQYDSATAYYSYNDPDGWSAAAAGAVTEYNYGDYYIFESGTYIKADSIKYESGDIKNGIYIKNTFTVDDKEYSSYTPKTFYIESKTSDGKDCLITQNSWGPYYQIPKMYYVYNDTGIINLPLISSLYYKSDNSYILDGNIGTYSQYYIESRGIYNVTKTLDRGRGVKYYTFSKISDNIKYSNLPNLFIKNSESSFTKFSSTLGISTGNNYYYYNSNIEDNGHINYIAKPNDDDILTCVDEIADDIYRNNVHLTYLYDSEGTYQYGYPIDRIYIPISLQRYDVRNNVFETSDDGMYIKSLRFDMTGTQGHTINDSDNDKEYEYNSMYISAYSDYKINKYGILTPLNKYSISANFDKVELTNDSNREFSPDNISLYGYYDNGKFITFESIYDLLLRYVPDKLSVTTDADGKIFVDNSSYDYIAVVHEQSETDPDMAFNVIKSSSALMELVSYDSYDRFENGLLEKDGRMYIAYRLVDGYYTRCTTKDDLINSGGSFLCLICNHVPLDGIKLTNYNLYDADKLSFRFNTIFAMNPNVFIKKDSIDSYTLYQLEFNDNNTTFVANLEYEGMQYSGPIYVNGKNARLYNIIDENMNNGDTAIDYKDKNGNNLFTSRDLYFINHSTVSETGYTSASIDSIIAASYILGTNVSSATPTYDQFKNGAYYINTSYGYALAEDYNKDETYYTISLKQTLTGISDKLLYKAFTKAVSKFGYDVINNSIIDGNILTGEIFKFISDDLNLDESITELKVKGEFTAIENLKELPAYCVENDSEYSNIYRFDTTSMQKPSDKSSYIKHNLLPMIMTAKPEYYYRLSDSTWTNEGSDTFYDAIVRGRYFYSYIDRAKYEYVDPNKYNIQDIFRDLYVAQRKDSDILSESVYYISTRCLTDPYNAGTKYYRRNDIFDTDEYNSVGDVYIFNNKNSSFVKADYDESSTDKYYKLIEDPYYTNNDYLYGGKKSYYTVFQTYGDGSGRTINYDYIKSGDSYIKDDYIKFAFIPYFILKNNENIVYRKDGISDIIGDDLIKKFMTIKDAGTIELSSLNIENMRNLTLTLDAYTADGKEYTPSTGTSTLYDLMKKSASFNFNMCDYGDSVYLYDQSKFGNPTLLYGANNRAIFIDTQYLKYNDSGIDVRVIKYTINKFKFEVNKKSLKISDITTECEYVVDKSDSVTSYDDYGYDELRKPLLPLQLVNSKFCYTNEDTMVTYDNYTNNDIYFVKRIPEDVSGEIKFDESRKIDIGKLYFTNTNSPDIFITGTNIYSTIYNMPDPYPESTTLNPIELSSKITQYEDKIMDENQDSNMAKIFADRYYVSPKQVPIYENIDDIVGDYAVTYSKGYIYLTKDDTNHYYIKKYVYEDSYVDGVQKLYRYDSANNSYLLIPQENIFNYANRYYFIPIKDIYNSESSSEIYQMSTYIENVFIQYDKTQKEYLAAISENGVRYYYSKLTNSSNDIYLKVHDDNGLYVRDEGFSDDDKYEQYVEESQTLIASVKFNDKIKIDLFGLDFGIGVYYLDRPATHDVGDAEYRFDKNIGINIEYTSKNDIVSASLYDIKSVPGGYPKFYNNCLYVYDNGNAVELKSNYILTNVYRNVNTIDLYKDISKFVHHITTLTTDEYNNMKAFKYIPLIQYSKSLNDEYVDKLIENTTTAYNLLDDLSEKVVNNFSIDYKYFKSYGPSKYFTMIKPSDKDYGNSEDIKSPEILLKKLDIDLDIDIYIIPKADINDLDISQDVKMVLISYINELSKSNEDYTLYLSNIQTEVENKFVNYIRSTEIVINKEPDYRIIKYTKPVNNGNVDIIEARDIVADYVPECISLPIENITVRIIR